MSEEEIVNELKKLNSWMKVQSRNQLKSLVEEQDDINKVLISEADGDTPSDLSAHVDLSRGPIYKRMQKMARKGIVRKNSEGEWTSLCSLEDLGIDKPELKVEDNG